MVRFIKTALRTLLLAGLVVAAGAFFTGPSAAAVRTRHALSSGLGRLRHGGESGPASRWIYAHRHGLRIGVVALAALIVVFWGQPTAPVVVAIEPPPGNQYLGRGEDAHHDSMSTGVAR